MRLTCPNCSARYEVDESMIPAAGRDVQCSNCGTTWFQPGPRVDAVAPPSPSPPPENTPAPDAATNSAPQPAPSAPAEPADSAAASSQRPERPPRRKIDSAVAEILREEAEREAQLRRSPAPDPVETQSEMALGGSDEQARLRRLAEIDDAEGNFSATAASAIAASRGELLPDIDEINSSLRATSDRDYPDDPHAVAAQMAGRRRGVRRGFFLVLLLAGLGTFAYANAELLSQRFPQAGKSLTQFVSAVDQGRYWLDDMARRLAQVDVAGE